MHGCTNLAFLSLFENFKWSNSQQWPCTPNQRGNRRVFAMPVTVKFDGLVPSNRKMIVAKKKQKRIATNHSSFASESAIDILNMMI